MKRLLGSFNNSRTKKIACTVSAAALMLGVSSAATVGLHFQENYCGAPDYSGYPVTLTAFGIAPSGWENLLEMNTGYSSCSGPLGYTLNELIDTTTTTNGLNPLPNGSLNLTWFGPTANYTPFAGYAGSPANYYCHPGGSTAAIDVGTNPVSGEEQIYATFIRDGINFGPPGGANNDQPGYMVDITGLKSVFTNSSFVVELMASADSMQTITNAMIIDVTDLITNLVSYPNTPLTQSNAEGGTYWQGPGGGLSTGSAAINADHIQIKSVQPVHVPEPGGYNHGGTICGFIITDKPVVSMAPQSISVAGPGDTIALSAYAIGVPPLSYQWQHNGQSIPGATAVAYTFTNTSAADGGSYALVVTNIYGATTSVVSTVTVDQLVQTPTNGLIFDSNPVNSQHNGINMGATWQASSSDGTVTRDGVMDFVAEDTNGISVEDAPAFDGPAGTITFWMQSAGTDQNAPGSQGASLFCRPATNGSYNDFLILQDDGSPGQLYILTPGGIENFFSTRGVSDDKWHFVALAFNQTPNNGVALYIDGSLDTTNSNGTDNWEWTTNQPLEIGYSSDPTWRDYNGALNDVRYYNTALTGSQISTIYSSGAIANSNALQLEFNFAAAPGTGYSLTWKEGAVILQSAPTVTGPWSDVQGATSPYNIVPSETQQFFRYRGYVPITQISNPYLM